MRSLIDALILLPSLGHVITDSKWRDLFEGKPEPYRSDVISVSMIPAFMKGDTRSTAPVQHSDSEEEDQGPKTEYGLCIERNPTSIAGKSLELHAENYLKPNDLFLPKVGRRPIKNPTGWRDGAEWRDMLRLEVDAPLLFIDLQRINYVFKNERDGEEQETDRLLNHAHPEDVLDWMTFVDRVEKTACKIVEIHVWFCPLTTPQEGYTASAYPFEYSGGPPETRLFLDEQDDIVD